MELCPIRDTQADAFVALDHSQIHLRSVRSKIAREKRLLVIREGRSVRPDQFRHTILEKYGTVFVPTRNLKTSNHFCVYDDGFLPRDQPSLDDGTRTPESVCVVNTNKFSLHPESNYSFRQSMIVELVKSGFKVAIAGKKWDASGINYGFLQLKELLFASRYLAPIDPTKFRKPIQSAVRHRLELKGFVTNSVEFMSNHVYALVIENDGFCITEKFFDALAAGCIPIYYGPDLDRYGIPSDIYVKIEGPGRSLELLKRLHNLSSEEQSLMRQRARVWISKPEVVARWSQRKTMEQLWMKLQNKLDSGYSKHSQI